VRGESGKHSKKTEDPNRKAERAILLRGEMVQEDGGGHSFWKRWRWVIALSGDLR